MAAVLNESGYDRMLRTEGSQERLDNVAELKQSIYEFETTCGEEVTLEHYLSHGRCSPTPTRWMAQPTRGEVMTIHARRVGVQACVLCSMSEGVLPLEEKRERSSNGRKNAGSRSLL